MQRSLYDALNSVHDNVMNAPDEAASGPQDERPKEIIAFDMFGQPVTTKWFPIRVARDSFGDLKFRLEAYFAPPTMIEGADTFFSHDYYPSDSAFKLFTNQLVGRKLRSRILAQFERPSGVEYDLDLIVDGRHISDGLKQNSSPEQLNIFDTTVTARAFGTEFEIEVSFPQQTTGATTVDNYFDNDAFGYYKTIVRIDGDVVYQQIADANGKPNDHYMLGKMFDRFKRGAALEHLEDMMVYA